MTPAFRSWLLDCPHLAAVSTLALDAAACGLINLGDAIARAVSLDARVQTLGLSHGRETDRLGHVGSLPWRHHRLRVQIVSGTAVLRGAIARGADITQSRRGAALHLDASLPDTVIRALVDKPLGTLISTPLLDARSYVIENIRSAPFGLVATFAVLVVPIPAARAQLASLSRGTSARQAHCRARSR